MHKEKTANLVAEATVTNVDKRVEALLAGTGDADSGPVQSETDRLAYLIAATYDYDYEPREKTPAEIREGAKRAFFESKIREAQDAEMPPELADLEDNYLAWRQVLFLDIFNNKRWPNLKYYAQQNGTTPNYEKEKAKWLSHINREEDYYFGDPTPKDYFRKKIAPLAIYMSKHNGKNLTEVAADALTTFKIMMRLTAYGGTICKVQPGVINNIFAVGHNGGSHGNNSGQYRYFYNKYGKWAAYAVTVFQADISDEHYDGLNYSLSTYRLETIFGTVAKLVPEEFREFVFKGAVDYGDFRKAETFLRGLPGVIRGITEAGRADILPVFYRFLKATHTVEDHQSGFAIFDAETVINEMDALIQTAKYKDEILESAVAVVRIGSTGYSSPIPSFVTKPIYEGKEWFYSRDANFPALIKKLEAEGCDEETIKMILAVPINYPWLGDDAFTFMWNTPKIRVNFAGGLEAFLKYLEENKNASRSKGSIIEIMKNKDFSQSERDLILKEGVEVVKLFGYQAHPYFHQFEKGIGETNKQGIRLLTGKPEEFKAALKEIHELVAKCGDKFEGRDMREAILEELYKQYGEKHYESLAEGYEIIIDRLVKLLKTIKAAHDIRFNIFHTVIEHYNYLAHSLESDATDGFSTTTDYAAHAKVLVDFAMCENAIVNYRDYREMYHEYITLLRNGASVEIAAITVIAMQSHEKTDLKKLFKKYKVSEEKTGPILDAIMTARDLIYKVDAGEEVRQSEITSARRKLEEVTVDEDVQKYLKTDGYLSELDRIAKINFFKEACKIGIGSGTDLENSGTLMRTTNQSTKMAIGGVSLLLSAGAMQFDNMEDGIVPLPVDSNTSLAELGEILADGRYEHTLRQNIAMILPRLERAVIAERARMPGLLPVGGKIHTLKEVDEAALNAVENIFGLPRGTCFRLIHANKTLLLPPLPSALEMQMLIQVLGSFGVIDLAVDDIQICAAGRRPEENAAIVGSATVLSRNIGRTYAKGAFQTTHSTTGARIMAYDAGVKNPGLPFDFPSLAGRTDILGTRDLTDIGRFQVISTLAGHDEMGIGFAPLMRVFKEEYSKVLKRAGLEKQLRQSAWVYDNAQPGDDLDNHEDMLRRFTDKWMYASGRPGFGVIRDVKTLIAQAKGKIEAAAPTVIADDSEEFDRLLKY
ncbi:hypothetical protein HY463_00400 [Candidatus Peregrinibacteria bacterium]|nr:hypothetical protein [Candidatus Peregrinibacteria bacterium]